VKQCIPDPRGSTAALVAARVSFRLSSRAGGRKGEREQSRKSDCRDLSRPFFSRKSSWARRSLAHSRRSGQHPYFHAGPDLV